MSSIQTLQVLHLPPFCLRKKLEAGKNEDLLHFIKMWGNVFSALFLSFQKFVCIRITFGLLSKKGLLPIVLERALQ